MQHLHAIGEDEMVAVFLQTEVASTRFASTILAILRRDGRERRIIDQPDLSNAADNAYRRHVLGEYRGYGRDADVFTDFPADVPILRREIEKRDRTLRRTQTLFVHGHEPTAPFAETVARI